VFQSQVSVDGYDRKDNKTNYLIKDGPQFSIYIQKDKVSNNREPLFEKLPDSLCKILYTSLRQYPRSYLLSLVRDKHVPMKYLLYYQLLKSIDSRLSVDTIRTAFITNLLSKFVSENELKKYATMMRTSVHMMRTEYLKREYVNRDQKEPEEKERKIQVRPIRNRMQNRRQYLSEYMDRTRIYNGRRMTNRTIRKIQNKRSYSKYIENNKEQKLINDYLRLYNHGVMSPSKRTIQKYNLEKIDGIWRQNINE